MTEAPVFLADNRKIITKALLSRQLQSVQPESWSDNPQLHVISDDIHSVATRGIGQTSVYLFGPQEQYTYLLGVGWNSGTKLQDAEMRLMVARDRAVRFNGEYIFDTEQFLVGDEYPVLYFPTRKWQSSEESAAYYRLIFESVARSKDYHGWKEYLSSPDCNDFQRNAIERALEQPSPIRS